MTGVAGSTHDGIAVTGIGVVTPLADRVDALAAALASRGRSIARAAELGDVGESRIVDFDATRYTSIRGLRIYNRATRLGICAAKLALEDARLEAPGPASADLGLVMASTFGHMDTLVEYDRSLVTLGLQRTNPAWMPLAIPSAPGAIVALSYGAKAFCISLSDGGASSVDAVALGSRLLQSGRARACLVVGAFALCRELTLSAARAGLLAPPEGFRVFDRRSRGTVLGEAGAALVLERVATARERGVEPVGRVMGSCATFAPTPADVEGSLRESCAGALRAAGASPSQLGVVGAGAGGVPSIDGAEARALLDVIGRAEGGRAPVVIAPKANLGDTLDASGLLQLVVALSAVRSGVAPPIPELEQPAVAGLDYALEPREIHAPCALVTSVSHTGACSALVVSAPEVAPG